MILAGSGTLGWDLVAANLIEQGDKALVINSGYFGDEFGDCLSVYGANVTHLRAPVGGRPSLAEVEAALKKDQYKVVTLTHVDTSTGVLGQAKEIGELVKRVSPGSLYVLDAVCALASEEIQFDSWGIDVVVSASQKGEPHSHRAHALLETTKLISDPFTGISAPPGLSLTVWSEAAIKALTERKSPVVGYFTALKRWLPIMKRLVYPAYAALRLQLTIDITPTAMRTARPSTLPPLRPTSSTRSRPLSLRSSTGPSRSRTDSHSTSRSASASRPPRSSSGSGRSRSSPRRPRTA